MQRVLVTGAGGYIGTTLVPELLKQGYLVRAIDRFFFGHDLLPEMNNLERITEDSRHLTADHFDGVNFVIDLVAISNDPSGELFQQATWEINHESRVRTATLAKAAGVQRYILPSSCSIYGWQAAGVVCQETSEINPLTTYAKANRAAEEGVLALADDSYTVVVLRQATIFGLSSRMRFDLAINGMTWGAWSSGKLPLLRDGTQWRPMLHVRDAAEAQIFMLQHDDPTAINGEIFNVGSAACNYQLQPLAEIVAQSVPRDVEIEWYGDPDHRSYQADFQKLEALGFQASRGAEAAVVEICEQLEQGTLDREPRTITLDWYQELVRGPTFLGDLAMYGGILDLDEPSPEI